MDVLLNLSPGDYSLEWINVSTGETTQRETFAHQGGEKHAEAPPFEQEIALRLTRTNP